MTANTLTPTAEQRISQLARMLDPRSIAVIGASTNPTKRGHHAIRALQDGGYPSPVYPVNPTADTILGMRVTRSIADLPFGIDVALIALPGHAVPDAIRECARVGIAGAVVLANGFGETGSAEGAEFERQLRLAVADTGIRVIGPNTSGMLNASTGANLVGLQQIPSGPISVITQSGNMLLSLVNDNAAVRGPGFHTYVGLGNQLDVRYDECVTALAADGNTGAIAIHSEGLKDARAFLRAAREASVQTPIVMLRGGRSEVGRKTALSHTGSIAGSDAVATAVLRQAGVELVDRSDELAVVAGALAVSSPMRAGTAVAILSDGGGHATLAADALAARGIELAEVDSGTRDALRSLLGPAAAVSNPVDVAGATDTDPQVFVRAAELLMTDPGVGLVLIVGLFGGYHLRFDPNLETSENTTSADLVALTRRTGVPLVVQSCYAATALDNHDTLRAGGVPVIASIDHAIRVVTALHTRGHWLATRQDRSTFELPQIAPFIEADAADPVVLDEPAARGLVERAGVDLDGWTFAPSVDDVVTAVADYGRPCAVKVVSTQVIHKSDVGGVRLGVSVETAAADTAQIIADVTRQVASVIIDGFVVTPMAQTGVELLIGATRDPIFGPVVAFGSGGVLVEALGDVSFRAAPFTHREALEMIEETIASRMLDGYRNLPSVDRDALADFLTRTGEVLSAHPEITELDLNPVIASGARVVPVDVRIVTAGTTPRGE